MAETVIWDHKERCHQPDALTRLSGICVSADDI